MSRSREPHVLTVSGIDVRVDDSLANFQLVCEALDDDLLEDGERFDVLLYLLYADPQGVCDALGDHVLGFLLDTLWEAFGIDLKGEHETDDRRLLDWEQDHDRIVVTCRAAYGMGYDEFEDLPYKECCLLMGLAPHETPMGQAIHYRVAKPPKATKYNREQVEDFRKAQKFYRLEKHRPTTGRDATREANDAASASFRAMAAAAQTRESGGGDGRRPSHHQGDSGRLGGNPGSQ